MPANKIFKGHVVRANENSFEGQDGAQLEGKNIELVMGNRGVKAWCPKSREGYTLLVEDAYVEIECSVRVRDDNTLKYTVIWAKTANESVKPDSTKTDEPPF